MSEIRVESRTTAISKVEFFVIIAIVCYLSHRAPSQMLHGANQQNRFILFTQSAAKSYRQCIFKCSKKQKKNHKSLKNGKGDVIFQETILIFSSSGKEKVGNNAYTNNGKEQCYIMTTLKFLKSTCVKKFICKVQ